MHREKNKNVVIKIKETFGLAQYFCNVMSNDSGYLTMTE